MDDQMHDQDDQIDEEEECPLEKAVTYTGLGLSWELSASEDSEGSVLGVATCYLCKRNKNNTSYVIPPYPNNGLEPRKLTISAWQISFPEEKRVYRYWLCNECWLLLVNIPFMKEVDGVRPDAVVLLHGGRPGPQRAPADPGGGVPDGGLLHLAPAELLHG